MVLQFVSPDRQRHQERRFQAKYLEAVAANEHLWIATVAYTITPPLAEGTSLDMDNMAIAPAVGCFICERSWSETTDSRCTGEPV